MKSNGIQKSWKKVARVAYASMIVLQSVLVGPALAHASSGPAALTATLLAQRDAAISSSQAGVNQGDSNLLAVSISEIGDIKQFSDALLWFDTTTLPVGATIVRAQLSMVEVDSSGGATFLIAPEAITSSWEEMSVTWDSKPQSANEGDGAVMVAPGVGIRDRDVTKIVQAWVDSTLPNNGILLDTVDESTGGRFFASREEIAHAPRLIVNYELEDAPSVEMSNVPVEEQRFASQLLAEMRESPMAPGWENAELAQGVRPLYRPDIQGVAYYEFQVVRPAEAAAAAGVDTAAGFIIVSATDRDYPIAHWGYEGLPPSRQLDALAQAEGKVAHKFYKLDTLSYVAEDIGGNMVATLGELPEKLSGMDPAWLNQPEQLAQSMPGQPSIGGDGVFHAGAQMVTGSPPPSSIKITAWDSWQALKSGFVDSFGVLAEDLHRHALKEWTIDRRADEIGEGLRKGEIAVVATLALPSPLVTTSGPGTKYIQTENVETNGKLNGLRVIVTGAEKNTVVPFQVDIAYGNGVTETIKYRVLQDLYFHSFMPMLSNGSSSDSDSQMATVASGQETQNMYSWSYYYAGSDADQRRYDQIHKHTGPNHGNCVSGCGPTAWAMLFGWVDYRASQLDPKWKDRFGIYRWEGSRLGDVVAPHTNDSGIMNALMEINFLVGTFCVLGEGATFPWDMDQVTGYLDGRTGAVIGTNYNSFAFHTDRLYDLATNSISRRQTPVIIGTGWVSSAHYPLAYGYAWRMRRVDGDDEIEKMLKVNLGHGAGKPSQWIHEGTFFVGNIWPCFEMSIGLSKCAITPKDVN